MIKSSASLWQNITMQKDQKIIFFCAEVINLWNKRKLRNAIMLCLTTYSYQKCKKAENTSMRISRTIIMMPIISWFMNQEIELVLYWNIINAFLILHRINWFDSYIKDIELENDILKRILVLLSTLNRLLYQQNSFDDTLDNYKVTSIVCDV